MPRRSSGGQMPPVIRGATNSLGTRRLPVIVALVDAVSNGNLLLSMGPRADSSIADHDREAVARHR